MELPATNLLNAEDREEKGDCKLSSHNDNVCRKQKHHTKAVNDTSSSNDKHSYAFKVSDDLHLDAKGTDKFLVDCGATTHIVNSDMFIETDKLFKPKEHFIELANGSKSNNLAKKKGTVLISLHTVDEGAKVNFNGNHGMLTAPDGTNFPIEQHGRLYYLCKTTATKKRSENLETWHKLLGHCNVADLKKLENVVEGMNVTNPKEFDCETCI